MAVAKQKLNLAVYEHLLTGCHASRMQLHSLDWRTALRASKPLWKKCKRQGVSGRKLKRLGGHSSDLLSLVAHSVQAPGRLLSTWQNLPACFSKRRALRCSNEQLHPHPTLQ